jgi:hypothetical protein
MSGFDPLPGWFLVLDTLWFKVDIISGKSQFLVFSSVETQLVQKHGLNLAQFALSQLKPHDRRQMSLGCTSAEK